jgi:hypothetical protein
MDGCSLTFTILTLRYSRDQANQSFAIRHEIQRLRGRRREAGGGLTIMDIIVFVPHTDY